MLDVMTANLAHFAINADDVPASRSFYESVFGWTFSAWGPPGFYQIDTGPGGVQGAMQQRRRLAGRDINGLECTFAVEDETDSVGPWLAHNRAMPKTSRAKTGCATAARRNRSVRVST